MQQPPSPLVDISLLKPGQKSTSNQPANSDKQDENVPQYMRHTAASRKRRFDSPLTHVRPVDEVFPNGKDPLSARQIKIPPEASKTSPSASPRSSRFNSPTKSTSPRIKQSPTTTTSSAPQSEKPLATPSQPISRPLSASKNGINSRLSSTFASNVQRFSQKSVTTPSPNQYALPTLDELDKILSKQRNTPTSSFRNSGHKIDDVLNLKESKIDSPSPHTYTAISTTNKKAPSPSASFRSSTARIAPLNSKKVDFRVEYQPVQRQ